MSNVSLFSFKGIPFVAGLFWQTLPKDATKENLFQLAAEIHCDLLVHRTDPSQYGFASLSDNDFLNKKTFSAAAVLSKSMEVEGMPGNVLSAFALPDGHFMLFAQRSHAILPLYGDIIGSEDEIVEAFNNHIAAGWDSIIAPSEWSIPGASFRDFSSFVPQKKGKVVVYDWWRLRSINEKSKFARYAPHAALAAVVLSGLFYGYSKYQESQLKQKDIDRIAQETAQINSQRLLDEENAKKPKALKAAPHPWASSAKASKTIEACQSSLYSIPYSPMGWTMKSFECSPSSFTANYGRQISTAIEMKRAYPAFGIAPDGESATTSGALKIECCDKEEEVFSKQEAYLQLLSFYQRFRINTKIDETPPAQPTPVEGVALSPPDWTVFKWSFEAIGSPLSMISALSIPGIRVEKISFSPTKGAWFMEGVLYAKNN